MGQRLLLLPVPYLIRRNIREHTLTHEGKNLYVVFSCLLETLAFADTLIYALLFDGVHQETSCSQDQKDIVAGKVVLKGQQE